MATETDGVTYVATTRPGDMVADVSHGGIPDLVRGYGADRRIDVSLMDAESRTKVRQVSASVQRLDGAVVNGYGAAVQQKANRFLDELLQGLRTKDAGASGMLVAEVAKGVKLLDIPGLKREAEGKSRGGFLAGLPMVGKYVSAFDRFRANQATIIEHFVRVEEQGRREMARLAAMDSKLDQVVTQNLEAMRELEVHVAAGQEVLDRERDRFARAREAALASRDPARIAAVRDMGDQINAFESRLLRLHMAMTDAMLNVPQTRLTQSTGRIEYRNVSDTLLFDIPRLKQAILRVVALKNISDASKASDARRRLAQSMAQAGIESLETAYVKAKESEGGALAEIATMGAIADRIIGIVDKGAEIDARNRETRREAAARLSDLRERFVDGLARSTANAVASTEDR